MVIRKSTTRPPLPRRPVSSTAKGDPSAGVTTSSPPSSTPPSSTKRSPPTASLDVTQPGLSPHVSTSAPAPTAGAGGGSSLFSLRLGSGGVKPLWNKLQALVGVGDPASLKRAGDVVAQMRVVEQELASVSDEGLRERLAGCRGKLGDVMRPVRDDVAALEQEAAELEARGDVRGAAAKRELADGKRSDLLRLETEALDTVLPEVFALASETTWRQVQMRPYDAQVTAGALLQRGKIVEQYTGEGKTLSAVAPTVLNALTGRGVHVATSSNYLAKRDAEEMAPVYNALGLSVSALLPDGGAILFAPPTGEPKEVSRADAYRADITYATATQLGFDHLRDNLVTDRSERVQRGHAALLLDEVDSLLIDDARTPLIIAGRPEAPQADVRQVIAAAVERLEPGRDLEFDRAEGWAVLSDGGSERLAESLGLSSPLDFQAQGLDRLIDAAVRARVLFVNGIDYVAFDGKVELIGQNGEMLPGRRLSNGLHQAIESREGVEVQPETRTIGSITLREYLGLYSRIGGMTGTAETSEQLFQDVYGLDVVRVPTHRPLIRKDEPTRLFSTIEDKAMAVMHDAVAAAKGGRPVLIGVPDERSAEALSLLLSESGVEHALLTATNDELEAKVIAEAGAPGRITIATPKGGRGVDFKLGGKGADDVIKQAVVDRGGLLVLGFSHNAAERIDNQLRGRAGRQGQPGTTRFYASLEDRFFHGKALPAWVKERPPGKAGLVGSEVTALVQDHSALSDSLMTASLKDSVPYDNVMGAHRQRYLAERDVVMHGDVVEGTNGIAAEAIAARVARKLEEHGTGAAGLFALYVDLAHVVPLPERKAAPSSWAGKSPEELSAHILERLQPALSAHLEKLGEPGRDALKLVLLEALDDGFSYHLEDLASLRQGIGWQSLAEKDPRVEFVLQADGLWAESMEATRDDIARAACGGMPTVSLE